MEDDFGIAATSKPMALAIEEPSQFAIVVDLAVEHDDQRVVFVRDRLMPAFHIDDGQTARPQRRARLVEEPLTVRTAVTHCGRPRAHLPRLDGRPAATVNDSADAAPVR